MLLGKYDYVTIWNCENVHWYIADAEGNYAVLEYWGRGTAESPFQLYVMDDITERYLTAGNSSYYGIPYEYNCIENYYCNPKAASTYNEDKWQHFFNNKVRIHHMVSRDLRLLRQWLDLVPWIS